MTSLRVKMSLSLMLVVGSLGCYRRTMYCSEEFPCDPGYSCEATTRLCVSLGDGATSVAAAPLPPPCTQFSAAPQTLPSSDLMASSVSSYGQALAISRAGWIAIGAPGQGNGAVDLYSYASGATTLSPAQLLNSFDSGVGAGAALAFSADGNTLFVGAPQNEPGQVYVFKRNGSSWQSAASPIKPGLAGARGFGQALATAGDELIVGAPGTNSNSGAVFTFSASSPWAAKGSVLSGAASEYFGAAVAMTAGRLLVGAPNTQTGAVYAFVGMGGDWKKAGLALGALALGGGARFGSAIAISDSAALVGAPMDGNGGSVSFFTWSSATGTWSYQASLPSSGGTSGDSFGGAVALYGTSALVGAADALASTGRASLHFQSTGWGAPILLNPGTATTYLGSAAALSGELALVSATGATAGLNGTPKTFAYFCNK